MAVAAGIHIAVAMDRAGHHCHGKRVLLPEDDHGAEGVIQPALLQLDGAIHDAVGPQGIVQLVIQLLY